MKKTAIFLTSLTFLSRVFGLLRDLVLSNYYGAGPVSDAYNVALQSPLILLAFLAAAVGTSFVPIYTRISKHESIENADSFMRALVNLIFIISMLIFLVMFLMPGIFVKLIAYKFKLETYMLAVDLTRIFSFTFVSSSLQVIFISYLQINKSFMYPAISVIISNLIMMLGYYFGHIYNSPKIMTAFSTAAYLLQFMIIYIVAKTKGYRHRIKNKNQGKKIRQVLILAAPIMLSVGLAQINLVLDKSISTSFGDGALSTLNYSSKLTSFAIGIIVVSISSIIYPVFSRLAIENKNNELKSTLSSSIVGISILAIPAALGLMFFSKEIVRLVYGRGEFGERAIILTSSTLFYYALGTPFTAIRELVTRVYYAKEDTKTPMVLGAIAILINIVLNFVLSKYMGLSGLALATTISIFIATLLGTIMLRKKYGLMGFKKLSRKLLIILISSLIMSLITYTLYNFLLKFLGLNISLILSILAAIPVYLGLIYIFKLSEFREALSLAKSRLKSTKS